MDVTRRETEKTRTPRSNGAEAEIMEFAKDFIEAIRNGNLDEIMSFYAPDVVAFDMMPPFEIMGRDAYRKSWQMYSEGMIFPTEQEMSHVDITCHGDVAFCRSLMKMKGQMKDGQKMDMSFRNTSCLRKINGEWLIVHEHNSVPIDMKTEKAIWNSEVKH
jgi:ketosteroid isomerase-like protein